MISYEPFWKYIEQHNISQYQLIKEYDISSSLLDKLRHNKNLRLSTLADLCVKLNCNIEDIVKIIK